MDEHSENLNSTITEMKKKKTLKGINSSLNEIGEQDQPSGRQSMWKNPSWTEKWNKEKK